MKKWIKCMPLVIVMMAFLLMMSGCGKKENDTDTKSSEFVYVPEYFDLDMKNGYMNDAFVLNDRLYLSCDVWDEDGQNHKTDLCWYDFEQQKMQLLCTSTDENISVMGLQAFPDGKLAVAVNNWTYIYDENDEIIDSEGLYEIWVLNPESGEIEEKKNLSEAAGFDGQTYLYEFKMDADGFVYCYLSDGEMSTIYILSPELSQIAKIEVSEGVNGLFTSKEGEVYAIVWGGQGIELRKINRDMKALDEALKIDQTTFYISSCCPGAEQSFLTTDDTSVYAIDAATASCEKLFQWMDADIIGNNVRQFGQFADGSFFAITYDYSKEEDAIELIRLTRKNSSEVTARTELTLGSLWIDDSVKRVIVDFNKNSQDYHISVKEYALEDYATGLTQFNADVASGNCPDIIDFSSLNYSLYANKGVFEDLYPYMEKNGIAREEFLPNVLTAYEMDGKLYGIPAAFNISTMMGKQSVLGDVSGWTLAEMLDFMESKKPEEVFSYNSQQNILYALVYNNTDEFINWETGECSFQGSEFARVLEYAKRLPEEYDYNDEEGEATKLRKNTLYLMRTSIGSVREFQMYSGMFGEKITFIGYPDADRSGNKISPMGGCLAISSKSKNKDAAWSFIQKMLGEECQKTLSDGFGSLGFPVRKSALDFMFRQDMTPDYDTNEDGTKTERPKTTWGYGNDFEIEIFAATQEEVDQVKALINSATKRWDSVAEELTTIISEETEPFLQGQKSASEVADIIQNRVQIYVNENK